jgi:hypothetical protein
VEAFHEALVLLLLFFVFSQKLRGCGLSICLGPIIIDRAEFVL